MSDSDLENSKAQTDRRDGRGSAAVMTAGNGSAPSNGSAGGSATKRRRRRDQPTVVRAPDENGGLYEYVDPEYLPPKGVPAKDWVRIPRRTGRLRRMIATFLLTVGMIGGAVYGAVWFVNNRLYPGNVDSQAYLTAVANGTPLDGVETIPLTIEDNATLTDVASQLDREGVVPWGPLWRIWAQRDGIDTVQAGDYVFPKNADADLARDILALGPAAAQLSQFNVPEGLELASYPNEVANDLDWLSDADVFGALASGSIESDFLADTPDGRTLEGLLFPATFEVNTDEDAVTVLQRMASEMTNKTIELNYSAAAASYPYVERPYDLIVMASLIEKEARTDADRAKISRVIHNRLAEGMPLQIDATFLYCVPNRQPGEVQAEWKNLDCPHNTYQNTGLPPTPIAAPGEASLRAAANPSADPELAEARFYVLCQLDGSHCFSNTLDEHNALIDQAKADGVLN